MRTSFSTTNFYKRTEGGYHLNISEYIEKRVDDQINWYDKKSKTSQNIYKFFQTVEIILAALIPLLSGYVDDSCLIPITIGVFGAIIAIIESITKLFKWHENWIEYRSTCELLRYQKHLYLTQSAPYNTAPESVENMFVRNIENIISAENNKWKSINTLEEKVPKETN